MEDDDSQVDDEERSRPQFTLGFFEIRRTRPRVWDAFFVDATGARTLVAVD